MWILLSIPSFVGGFNQTVESITFYYLYSLRERERERENPQLCWLLSVLPLAPKLSMLILIATIFTYFYSHCQNSCWTMVQSLKFVCVCVCWECGSTWDFCWDCMLPIHLDHFHSLLVFKKLILCQIEAIFHKVCNHWGKWTRKFIDVSWRLHDHHCFASSTWNLFLWNSKLTLNAMHLSIIVFVGCGSGNRSVSYLQEINGCLLRSHDILA